MVYGNYELSKWRTSTFSNYLIAIIIFALDVLHYLSIYINEDLYCMVHFTFGLLDSYDIALTPLSYQLSYMESTGFEHLTQI